MSHPSPPRPGPKRNQTQLNSTNPGGSEPGGVWLPPGGLPASAIPSPLPAQGATGHPECLKAAIITSHDGIIVLQSLMFFI